MTASADHANRAGRYQPRPTVYRGTLMRSRLEAGYAAWLDAWGFEWEYEPCAFGGQGGQYLPDFRLRGVPLVWHGRIGDVYVEVKHAGFNRPETSEQRVSSALQQLTKRMQVIFESEPDATLIVETPRPDNGEDDELESVLLSDYGPGEPCGVLPVQWTPSQLTSAHFALALRPDRGFFGPWHSDWWRA